MTTPATVTIDTALQGTPWGQSAALSTPEIAKVGDELTSRVQRALIARQYRRSAGSSGEAQLSGTFMVPHHGGIRDDIDRTIRAVFPPTLPPPALSLQPLQEWEGYVTDIRGDVFTARLTDLTAARRIEEETADFPIADLSNDDRELLDIGAVFRWVIGYQRSAGGMKRRTSQVTFRRLPTWTPKDLNHAQTRAAEFAEQIVWE